MSDSFDIFNLGVEDVETHQPERTSTNEVYKPTADDGKDGKIGRAHVRTPVTA